MAGGGRRGELSKNRLTRLHPTLGKARVLCGLVFGVAPNGICQPDGAVVRQGRAQSKPERTLMLRASTAVLKANETMPCNRAQRRISAELICTSETCEV